MNLLFPAVLLQLQSFSCCFCFPVLLLRGEHMRTMCSLSFPLCSSSLMHVFNLITSLQRLWWHCR